MKTHIFDALGDKQFAFLWISEIFTQLAVNLLNFFLILIVFQLTNSNTAVSGVVISFTLPAIFFGIIAGVYVDHWNKSKVLLSVNILRAILLLILAIGFQNLYALYALSLAISLATQFFIPAETPIIPLLVRSKNLFSANALFGMGIYGSILLSYIIAGPLFVAFEKTTIFFILAFLLTIGAFCISLIKIPKSHKQKKQQPFSQFQIMSEIRQTLIAVSKTPDVYHSLILLALSQTLILIIAVLAPGYATEILQIPVEEFPLVFVAPAAFGVVVGAGILVHFFHNVSKQRLINIGLFLSGIAMLILPYGKALASKEFVQTVNHSISRVVDISTIHMIILLAFVLGLANAFVFVPSNTLIQEKTSDQLRGKVYGVLNTLVGIFSLIPIILVGSLSDLVGVGKVLTGIGITLVLFGISRLFFEF